MQQPHSQLAADVARFLKAAGLRIVFAESCTAGLVSATLARVPGISEHHCGSAVVYRLDTKAKWLGVPEAMLIDPGPVSEEVAAAMAEGVLQVTPEADLAASITGHLGPDAPEGFDGLVYVGIASRCEISRKDLPHSRERSASQKPGNQSDARPLRHVIRRVLATAGDSPGEFLYPGETVREQRQWAAVGLVLALVRDVLKHE